MIAATQMKKPSNWQDFEKLCKLLWGEIWGCEDTIKRHGRQGQNQHGVDVFAYVERYGGYCGIQCKGKDEYTNAQLTEAEIDEEIEKAKGFEPEQKKLIFATTANKDAKIECYIRKRDVENRGKGLFQVDIASWEDIVDQLERYKTTYNWYVNNCQFKEATDVSVTFNGDEEIIIHPEYVRTTVHYEYKELTALEKSFQSQWEDLLSPNIGASLMPWNRPHQVDKRWCELNIRIDNISLFNNNVISICFKNIYLNEFLIKLGCFDDEKLIEQTFNTYMDIIKKSNIFIIQELQFLSYSILDNLSISDLHLQYNIILYILEFFSNSKIIKKTRPKILSFKFNTFKININRDTKSIQLFFDFSKIKEKTIFNYIIQNQKMNILYNKYEIIINNLREIKNYETKIRLMQSNFRSHQVNFLFSLIIKKLVDYIDDIKTSRIHILESKFNTFNPNMKVYIKNEKTKRKTRLEEIRHMIQDFPLNQKVKMLYNNISQLEQNFDLIMLSDNYTKDFRLIRRCDENQIYFFITKEKKKINLLEKEKQIEDKKFGSTGNLPSVENKNNKQSQQGYNNFLNIIFYIKNDQNSFMNIINFLENLLEDEQCELQNNITMICDRFYLESYVIMEPSLKSTVKRLFAIVDNYYTIAKKSKSKKINEDDDINNDNEDFNYDIYIADEFIAVENYHQYNNKTNNYSELIYEFLTCISGCIEFIVYTLRAKDIYLEKFYYIVRNMNDKHFFFEYKNSNIFIKQIKDFDSLIFFNEKKANPLLCIFPKIPESEYTISVDNFYDLYLRLFLNLNKVEEQKEKLSQIFLYKVHKNIFYENYDSIILIAYSYDAFYFFNDFFLKNNFLSTTKEKFNNVHFIPFDVKGNNNSYMKILENQKNNTLIANNLYIYEYGFNSNFKFSKPNLFLLSYKKSEYLLDKTKELINNKNFVQDREEKKVLFKILRNKKIKKESIKPIINNIVMLWKKNDKINIYHLSSSDYENVLKNYQKNVYQIQTQKVDMRLQNLTEDAINNYNNLKNKQKNCLIY